MRHEHLVVTVEAGTKSRIDDDLEPGESLESWVADAIEAKLAASADGGEANDEGSDDEFDGRRSDGDFGRRGPENGSQDDRGRGDSRDQGRGDSRDRDRGEFEDGDSNGERYYEGFEYVDDCSI